jgi:adenosine 3'-phospho 5'-phosphosulfate transporter B3
MSARQDTGRHDSACSDIERGEADQVNPSLLLGEERDVPISDSSRNSQTSERPIRQGQSDQQRSPARVCAMDLDKFLGTLPVTVQFSVLCLGVCVFFGIHNYLQESISRMDGFQGLGSILGYMEVFGVMVFSFLERVISGKHERTVAASSYAYLTLCLLGSSYLSTVGLDYINYPTKVVFRSCKLIPTMAVALIMHKQGFSLTEVTCAIAICAGLAMFAFADMVSVTTKVSTVFGLTLQALSTIADAFLPNLQQAIFQKGASTLEVTYFTNVYVFALMTLIGGGSGHIRGALNFVITSPVNGLLILLYSFVAYWAINFHIRVVQRHGSVVAVLVGNLRKAGTIALSFIAFPKPFSWLYVWGTILVFGGLTTTAYFKESKRRQRASSHSREKELQTASKS